MLLTADDLDIFYNTDEFAVSATWNGKELPVLVKEDEDITYNEEEIAITARALDVVGIKAGDLITVLGREYKVHGERYLDLETRLEKRIGLISAN